MKTPSGETVLNTQLPLRLFGGTDCANIRELHWAVCKAATLSKDLPINRKTIAIRTSLMKTTQLIEEALWEAGGL